MLKKNFKGFTLIELLIVMAILGLLVVLGASNFASARMKARDLKRKSDLSAVAKSVEAFVNDYGKYPTGVSGTIVCQPTTGVTCAWGAAFTDGVDKTIYMPELPQDDKSPTHAYYYESSNGASYSLYAALENINDPDTETLTLSFKCGEKDCNYKVTSSNIQ